MVGGGWHVELMVVMVVVLLLVAAAAAAEPAVVVMLSPPCNWRRGRGKSDCKCPPGTWRRLNDTLAERLARSLPLCVPRCA